LPKSMAAHVEVLGVDHRVDEVGESVTHRFLYKNPQPPVAAPAALSPWDTDPQFTVSTFADYAAVATAYRRTASAQAAVMPAVQALADEITAGTTDRREQAHLIYDWVSKHIRYVAIWLGNGGYVPHDAATILENRYGDCKDHVVLLESLLKAKGIASVAVLINTSNRYRLPEAATPGAFNHVLTYLPEFDLYVDSTAGVAPFGTLPAGEYGKPVAVAADTGSSLKTLPLVAPEENEETLQTTAELMTDGTVKGQSKTTATGPFGVTLRQVAAGIEAGGREHMAATQLRKFGWAGTGSYDFDPPRDDLISSYTVTASLDLERRPELLEGKAFGPPTGLRLLVQPGEFLLGSWTRPKAEPTPLLFGPSGRGTVLNPAAGAEHQFATARQDSRKSLSALPIGLESQGPNRKGAPRDYRQAASCRVPRGDPGQTRRGNRRDPRRLPQHDRTGAAGPLTGSACSPHRRKTAIDRDCRAGDEV
jgi:Transglutaminase-like superfamily